MRKKLTFLLMGICLSAMSQTEIPNLTLRTLDGQKIDVKHASEQQMVILCFWATWCEPCIEELNEFNALSNVIEEELKSKLIAVSIDDSRTISRVRPMVSGFNWKFDIAIDQNQEIKRALNFISIPLTIVIYKGKIVYEKAGYIKGDEKYLIEKIIELQSNSS